MIPGSARRKPGNVRPVFVKFRLHGSGHNRPRHIGAAPGKRVNVSRVVRPIEAWDYRPLQSGKLLSQEKIGAFVFKLSVFSKADYLRRVYKFIAQISRQKLSVQIFSSGSGILRSRVLQKSMLDFLKVFFEREL